MWSYPSKNKKGHQLHFDGIEVLGAPCHGAKMNAQKKINRLSQEKSPYLLQHQENPVDWYPWGEEAFQKAREQNKPIFLSIGYSTCHWCHVMAHQSFEEESVASVLNRNFIAIKVDREERPDVDEIYMSAVHAMGQRGGWPLSMFLTPDLKPFFGGTYWPKETFLSLLERLHGLWVEQREKLEESARSLLEHLRERKDWSETVHPLGKELFRSFFSNSLINFDRNWGGFGSAPKFPHSTQLSMLLRVYRRSQAPEALSMVVHSLDKMSRGGLYDHVGGGFARYSVDVRWEIPHFEKMLYDNALLAVAYLEAHQVTGIVQFAEVARETLDYTLRVLTHPEGGFYSAEDADSEGEEGKFYVWNSEELRALLSEDEWQVLQKAFPLKPGGNFEHGTHHLQFSVEWDWLKKREAPLGGALEKLFQYRERRIHPHKDDKVLTSWNGLMIRAMALGYQVLGEKKYLHAARAAADFLKEKLYSPSGLLARYRDGESRFAARLEDYAFLIQALIELYFCDFDESTLRWALALQTYQDQKFWDEVHGAYFSTDGQDPSLLIRNKEGMDGALPNANGVAAHNLLRLFQLQGEEFFKQRAQKIFEVFSPLLSQYPQAFSQMVMAYDLWDQGGQELALLAVRQDAEAQSLIRDIRQGFHPYLALAWGQEGDGFPALLKERQSIEGKRAFYFCRQQSCELPCEEGKAVLNFIEQATEETRYSV